MPPDNNYIRQMKLAPARYLHIKLWETERAYPRIDCIRFILFPSFFFALVVLAEKISLVLIASGSCLISLIMIVGCVSMCCCMRSKQRQLPPADIIPKVRVEIVHQCSSTYFICALDAFYSTTFTMNKIDCYFRVRCCIR